MKILSGLLVLCLNAQAETAADRLLGANPTPLPKFWPVCLYVEPGATPSLKTIADAMVKAAKRCKVEVMIQPAYVNNLPASAMGLATAADKFCGAEKRWGRLGITRASIAVVTKDGKRPEEFCKAEGIQDSRGCGQFAGKPSKSLEQRMQAAFGWTEPAAKDRSTVAIVAASDGSKQYPADRAVQEVQTWAMGVGMMGLPKGTGAGNGVGLGDEGGINTSGSVGSDWTDKGCEIMFNAAYDNSKTRLISKVGEWDKLEKYPLDIQKPPGSGDKPPSTAKLRVGDGSVNKGRSAGAAASGSPTGGVGNDGAPSMAGVDPTGARAQVGAPDTGEFGGAKGVGQQTTLDENQRKRKANDGVYGAGETPSSDGNSKVPGEDVPMGGHGQPVVGAPIPPPTPSAAPAAAARSAAAPVVIPASPTKSTLDDGFFNGAPASPGAEPSRRGSSTRQPSSRRGQ